MTNRTRPLTSIMMAKGTQHATAQQMPIKLTATMAYTGSTTVCEGRGVTETLPARLS